MPRAVEEIFLSHWCHFRLLWQ